LIDESEARRRRQALGRRLVRLLLDDEGQPPVLLLDPGLEDEILATLSPEAGHRLLGARHLGDSAGSPSRRFCEAAYRIGIRSGASRAPFSGIGPLSRAPVAGADIAPPDGALGRRDSS